MKTLQIALICVGLTISAKADAVVSVDALVGTWVLDIEKTKDSRRKQKEPIPGLAFVPKAEEVRARTLVFDATTLRAIPHPGRSTYRVFKSEGTSLWIEVRQREGEAPWYQRLEFTSSGSLIVYPLVAEKDNPMLHSGDVPSFYSRQKAE